jgi:hypothetical protein
MSFWRAVVDGLGLSQAFLMMGVQLIHPPSRVQTWVYTPCAAIRTVEECLRPAKGMESSNDNLKGSVVASIAKLYRASAALLAPSHDRQGRCGDNIAVANKSWKRTETERHGRYRGKERERERERARNSRIR